MKRSILILLASAAFIAAPARAGQVCANGVCTNDRDMNWTGANAFDQSPTAPTPSTADNSTKVATTAFFVAQFGQPHTWSAAQTFSGGISTNGLDLGLGAALTSNLYYSGGWKYAANGYGGLISFDPSGGLAIYTVPLNSSGAGAAASLVKAVVVLPSGGLQLLTYTTAGTLTNDASGNVSTTVGVTASGTSCTITAITKGVITGATC